MSTITNRELQETLIASHVAIVFDSLPNEVSYNGAPLPPNIFKTTITVPRSKDTDPFQFAQMCIEKCEEQCVYVLVPGKKFDAYGTRHGRGGGWYDRFLSAVPRSWIRIGITKTSDFSETSLPHNTWDEKMDWVLVSDGKKKSWQVYKTT